MFCSNCGAQLGDGAAFCVNCGTKIARPAPQAQTTAQPQYQEPAAQPQYEEPVAQPQYQNPIPQAQPMTQAQPVVQPQYQQTSYQQPQYNAYAQPKSKAGLIIALSAVGVAVVALIVVLVVIFSGKGGASEDKDFFGRWDIKTVYDTECGWKGMILELSSSGYSVEMDGEAIERVAITKIEGNTIYFITDQVAVCDVRGNNLTMYLDGEKYITATRR